MIKKYNLDCYISFTADEHLNEYIGDDDKVVKAITGFTGSNGIAITAKNSALITDGRYYIQAKQESKYGLYIGRFTEYLIENKYKRVGFDTRLVSSKLYNSWIKELTGKDIVFINVDRVKVDNNVLKRYDEHDNTYERKIDRNRLCNVSEIALENVIKNSEILNKIYKMVFDNINNTHKSVNIINESYVNKIKMISQIAGRKTLIISELDTIAWIFNIRGNDIEYNPVIYAYCVIRNDEVILFTDHEINMANVIVKKYNDFEKYLGFIKQDKVMISGDCNQFIYSKFDKIERTDLIRDIQAKKTEVQLCGMMLAQIYDATALCNLFGWIDKQIKDGKEMYENEIAAQLDIFKREMPGYLGPSFETISASATNASIIHYSKCDGKCETNKVFLLDAGSHYSFGTTDISRTLFLKNNHFVDAEYVNEVKKNYTLVLKGQLAAMNGEYKKKYGEIDKEARKFLYEDNKNFKHAVGHGVGQWLYVHEHPPSIYPDSNDEIRAGHVVAIEPGYYIDNEYGIRIENMGYVKSVNNNKFKLCNMTMLPYEDSLIDETMLNEEEMTILNKHNHECYELLNSRVNTEGLEYLKKNCKIIEIKSKL